MKKYSGAQIGLWIMRVFLVFISLLGIFSVVSTIHLKKDGISSFFGFHYLTVEKDYRNEGFHRGDLAEIQPITTKDTSYWKENETIVAYYFDEDNDSMKEIVWHYFSKEDHEFIKTQYVFVDGKGNEQKVLHEDLIGVYRGTKVPRLGNFLNFTQTSVGFLVVIVLPLFLCFLYRGFHLFLALKEGKIEKKEITEEEKEKFLREAKEEIIKELKKEE